MQKADDALRSRLGLQVCSPITFHQSPVTLPTLAVATATFGLHAVLKTRSLPRGGWRCRSAPFPAQNRVAETCQILPSLRLGNEREAR
jgi:hypothetical protein